MGEAKGQACQQCAAQLEQKTAGPTHARLCALAEANRERERERPPKEAFQTATGSEVGGERGGGPGRVKGTLDFGAKPKYLMQFSQTFLFYGLDSVASRAAAPKTILS